MTLKQRHVIYKEIAGLNDKQLLEETYKAQFDTLGSDVERMEDLGYDILDIKEAMYWEKFKSEKADIYTQMCKRRGLEVNYEK